MSQNPHCNFQTYKDRAFHPYEVSDEFLSYPFRRNLSNNLRQDRHNRAIQYVSSCEPVVVKFDYKTDHSLKRCIKIAFTVGESQHDF